MLHEGISRFIKQQVIQGSHSIYSRSFLILFPILLARKWPCFGNDFRIFGGVPLRFKRCLYVKPADSGKVCKTFALLVCMRCNKGLLFNSAYPVCIRNFMLFDLHSAEISRNVRAFLFFTHYLLT